MALCSDCERGHHHHDRYTGLGAGLAGARAGDDAGCPYVAAGAGCTCGVVLAPLNTTPAKHCPTCRCEP